MSAPAPTPDMLLEASVGAGCGAFAESPAIALAGVNSRQGQSVVHLVHSRFELPESGEVVEIGIWSCLKSRNGGGSIVLRLSLGSSTLMEL